MTDTDEWVDVSDPTAPVDVPIPQADVSGTPTNAHGGDPPACACPEMRTAVYNAFVCDAANPAPVYKAAGLCYVLRYPGKHAKIARDTARAVAHCNACTSRAGIYVRDRGPAGPVFFSQLAAKTQTDELSTADAKAVNRLRELAIATCAQDVKPELVVVTTDTYAAAAEGCKPCGQPYYHWTVHPAALSSVEAATRYEKLKNYYGQMDARLSKLTVPEAVESVKIMLEENPMLERPDHYTSVLRWVSSLQKLAAEECASGSGSFGAMTHEDQARLLVLAILSGRTDGRTHLDFHQSDNIVDFCLMPSRDALRAEMDRRSDPQFYMVSQLNRRLAAEGVTSQHLIGLTWDGKYTDDLDIHVITPSGKEIYYGNKSADGCKLDFDANVNKGEANPCENVSVKPGSFKVLVNNYTRRTFGEPIPFQVICRQQGMEDVVYDGVWDANRAKDRKIQVCRHAFTAVTDSATTIGMSAKSASRAVALNSEWTEKVGEPTATVATLDALMDGEGHPKAGTDVAMCGKRSPAVKTTAQVGAAFMGMALNAKDVNTSASKKKTFLSESCKAQPATVSELIAQLKAQPNTTLTIHPRDHSPGYLVSIGTATQGVRKTELPAPCHFHDRHSYPVKPVGGGAVGNARLDASWLSRPSQDGGRVRVEAVVKVAEYGCAFLALEGATLPRGEGRNDGQAFPLSSGFYTTELSADMHAHRERWGYFHTQLQPSMPPVHGGGTSGGMGTSAVPMVGAFLTGETAVVYVDGVKMSLKCR
uniref:Uncharacterized protein n=1 Tax=Haptolina brevifila TaxID=156173 RepID=A0A7S2JME5_9EUKA